MLSYSLVAKNKITFGIIVKGLTKAREEKDYVHRDYNNTAWIVRSMRDMYADSVLLSTDSSETILALETCPISSKHLLPILDVGNVLGYFFKVCNCCGIVNY